jgi:ornithine cyclodeaminase/alanine dehydrogenase-like protein (mu-crystallin family)
MDLVRVRAGVGTVNDTKLTGLRTAAVTAFSTRTCRASDSGCVKCWWP